MEKRPDPEHSQAFAVQLNLVTERNVDQCLLFQLMRLR